MTNLRPWRPWLISAFIFFGCIFLLDSCMQFRMSKTEVENYFKDKPVKGSRKQYREGNQKITYVQAGDSTKPLVLFVHGSPGSLSAFIHFLADSILLKHANLITVDRPGFGDANFGRGEPSLKKQAAVLMPAIRKEANGQPVILVGHSLGGPVIARMAMDYPNEINGLVLVAASIDPDLEPNEMWFRAPLHTPFLKWMLPRSFRASNDEIYKLKPELQEMLPLWETIRTSTIVVQGKKDNLVHPGNAKFAKEKMIYAPVSLVIDSNMNHFVPWTHPQLIRQAILDLIQTNQATTSSGH